MLLLRSRWISKIVVWSWFGLMSLVSIGLVSIYGKRLETKYYPVAGQFTLRDVAPEWVGDEIRIYGAFKKNRDCEYVPGNLTGYFIEPDGSQTRASFRSEDQPANTPVTRIVGLNNFGPWFFLAGPAVQNPKQMFIEVLHPCRTWAISKWFFGPMTRTVFGPFDIPERKKAE